MKLAYAVLCAAAVSARADEEELLRVAIDGRARLAGEAADAGLAEEAIREWQGLLVLDPDNARARAGIEEAGKPWVVSWDDARHKAWKEFTARRTAFTREMATRWCAEAAERAAAGDAEGEWDACQAALGYDADWKEARKRLGERKVDGSWVGEEEAARREQGLLEIGGEWRPAEEVKRRRGAWAEAWEVEGPHVRVRSNRSLAAAREVLARAEQAHAAFHREIMGVVDPAPLAKKLLVLDFASWDDLAAHVQAAHGAEEAPPRDVPGFFSWADGAVHLMPPPAPSVLSPAEIAFHECTHLAASRAIPPKGFVNARPQFWAWEGLASYFESIEVRDGKILTGSASHIRLVLARKLLDERRLVPLATFVKGNQSALGRSYEQAAALVHFFLHADGGARRERFLEFLAVVGRGEATAESFSKLLGDVDAIEASWTDYLRSIK